MESILTSVKKMIGLEAEYTHYDPDITMHINSVFLNLSQIGVGPEGGFFITGASETWADLLGERKDLEAVKTYVSMKVRLLFDPPTNSFVTDAMNRQIQEFEWRLNVQAEPKEVVVNV